MGRNLRAHTHPRPRPCGAELENGSPRLGPRPALSPAGSRLSASIPGEEKPSLFRTEAQQRPGSPGKGGGLEAVEGRGTQDQPLRAGLGGGAQLF